MNLSKHECDKWTGILSHPLSTPAQKATARLKLGIAPPPGPPEPSTIGSLYDPAQDAELEILLVHGLPKRIPGEVEQEYSPAQSHYLDLFMAALGGVDYQTPRVAPLFLAMMQASKSREVRRAAASSLGVFIKSFPERFSDEAFELAKSTFDRCVRSELDDKETAQWEKRIDARQRMSGPDPSKGE